MKINKIENLKKIYTKARSKNKTLYACVLPGNNIGMIRDELTFVKGVSDNSFRIYRPLDNTVIEIQSDNLSSFKFIC